jgi:hypothetical protein
MSVSGARGLIRVAHNPTCELQAAMTLARVREPDVYRALAGTDYPGEYGERVSARRRGATFEHNLYRDNAALLRETLAPLLQVAAGDLSMRNLVAEVPSERAAAMAERHRRTRALLADLAAGRCVPDLLIQPQLQLAVGGDPADAMYIAPDVLALSRARQIYLPVEIKSFIVRDGVVAPVDRDSARRQAAVQLLALRGELTPLRIADRLPDSALFIFATPFGLRPHPAFAEDLPAERYEMTRAVETLTHVRDRLRTIGVSDSLDADGLARLAAQLTVTYQESCVDGCLLASLCRQRANSQAIILGDAVAEVLGAEMSLPRAVALLRGDPPATARETRLAAALRDAAVLFGGTAFVQGRVA